MRVDFSRRAERDLREIALFISTENPARAISFVMELRTAAQQLGDFPDRYTVVGSRGGEPIRRRPYHNYVIIYRHDPTRVAILRIVHGQRITDDFIENL